MGSIVLAASIAQGSDAYLFRFHARGSIVGYALLQWQDVVLLFNRTETPLVVRVVEVSKGSLLFSSIPDRITIAPGAVVSLDDTYLHAWEPFPGTPASEDNLWMLHLDVPEGIVIQSRDEIVKRSVSPFADLEAPFALGGAPMPVFVSLAPAAKAQPERAT